MSLQFVIGSSGCGKTEYVYRQTVEAAGEHPKKNFLVVVPEQFTMQTQQKLVELAPFGSFMIIDVLSFKRLAYRVFDELGMRQVRVLEETGKNLVLRRLAQENEKKLSVLGANMNRMGYVGEVKSLISEFMQYGVSADALLQMAKRPDLSPLFAAKLTDIVTMYRAFVDVMEGSYITAEEILTVLKGVAPTSKVLKDAVIVLDEFTGFTPIQNELLGELLSVAERVTVTVTIDDREDFFHSRGSEELFDLSKKTIRTLMQTAKAYSVFVEEPVVLTGSEKRRFADAPALAFMERNLFRPRFQKLEGKAEQIRLLSAANPREELMLAAREINRLVRNGCRYRDIAVVTGSVETYHSYVEPVFRKYEIPYFLDTTRELLFHPFIEFLRAALEVVERGFHYEAVMRFLRCGFTDIDEDELDLLDNYLVATGIRGKAAFGSRWSRMPKERSLFNLERLEELRQEIYGLFEPLFDVFEDPSARVSDGILAIYGLLLKVEAERKLWEKEEELLAQDQQTKSKEYGQIYGVVMELLEKYNLLLGDEPLTVEGFSEVLDAGLAAAEVGVIPPGYDSVTIGDIERTRLNHIRILFFVGVNDGIIPKAAGAGGIISEYEREILQAADMELAPTAREQAFIQRFYLYRSLTKPSERLYLSYARVNAQGRAIRPSYLIGEIRRIFPELETKWHERAEAECDFYTKGAAFDYLIRGERDENWRALAKYFLEGEKEDRQKAARILEAGSQCYRGEPISHAVALALYGRRLEGSATRLERFAACAYAHYLQYGLGLREREICRFAGADMGNIYHTALERYSRRLAESGYDWFTVPEQVRKEYAALAMEEALASCPSAGIYARAADTYQTKRMRAIFEQTVWALTRQVRAGRFVPTEFEISFARLREEIGSDFGVVRLGEEESLILQGRIDRIDTCMTDTGMCVKIIDYKSGAADFDLVQVYEGRQLQLAVYMDAAMELAARTFSGPVVPAGILYYSIDDPVLTDGGEDGEEAEHARLLALRPDGLINRKEEIFRAMDENVSGRSEVIPLELKKSGEVSEARSHVADTEEFLLLERFVRKKMAEQAKAIYDGEVRALPYRGGKGSSCTYCPYGSVCGISPGLGYACRQEQALTKEEVLERIRTELALGEK